MWRRCSTVENDSRFDNYCGVKRRYRNYDFTKLLQCLHAKPFSRERLAPNATPQKSFGLREATIHTRPNGNSEHP